MSLLILASLIGIGLVILGVVRSYEDEYKENNICEYAGVVFTGYLMGLLFSAIGTLCIGAFWWLKNGTWLTISPYKLLSYLEHDNPIKQLLLSSTSWAGLQKINYWYLDLNIGWSFITVMFVLFMALVYSADNNT